MSESEKTNKEKAVTASIDPPVPRVRTLENQIARIFPELREHEIALADIQIRLSVAENNLKRLEASLRRLWEEFVR